MTPTNEAAEPLTDRRDAAIGYALLETEHLPGFARRGPAFREKLAQAGYRVEREAAEAAPSPDRDSILEVLEAHTFDASGGGQCSCGPFTEHVHTEHVANRLRAAPSLLQERDRLLPAPLDVERLAERLARAADRMLDHGLDEADWRIIAAEYARLSAQPSTEPAPLHFPSCATALDLNDVGEGHQRCQCWCHDSDTDQPSTEPAQGGER